MIERRKAHVGTWLLYLFLAVLLPPGLTGCADNNVSKDQAHTAVLAPATDQTAGPTTGTSSPEVTVATTTSGIASAGKGVPDYGIGPGDVLQIAVFNVPGLTTNVQVNVDGTILFPLIGPVKVAGLTTTKAAQEIATRLGQKYLQSPQVTVFVSHSAQRVSVNGAVERPGVITLEGTLTLSQAIAEAGGASDVANEKRVHIARLRPDQTVKDTTFDLAAIQGGQAQDPRLQSGDIVVVETSGSRQAYKTFLQLIPVIGTVATVGLMGAGL